MAKTSYLGANISAITSTFRTWMDRTNQLVYDMGTVVVTVAANSTGETTSGNAAINGTLSAQTLVAVGTLRGGTVAAAGNLTIGSNVVIGAYTFESAANTLFSNNVLVNGAFKANASANVIGNLGVSNTITANNLVANGSKTFGTINTISFTENSNTSNYDKFIKLANTGFLTFASFNLDDLGDVNAGSPTTGYVLGWTGTEWAPQPLGVGGSFSANTLSGNTIAAERFVQLGQLSLIGGTGFGLGLTVNTTSNTSEIVIKANTTSFLAGSVVTVGGNTIPASYIFGVTGNTHANGSVLVTGGLSVGGNVSGTNFIGALVGTAANATLLNNQPGAYYTNATNITAGTLPEAQLPFRMNQNVRTTDAVTFSNLAFTGTLAGNVSETSLPFRMNQNVRTTDNVTFNVITGTFVGNANTATALTTARNIAISGDVVGNVSFNGTADVTIAAAIQPNSVALGTDTTGNYVATVGNGAGITVSGSGSEGAAVTVAIDTSANVTFNVVTAALYGTANNAAALNNQPASFYTNASNLASGTVPVTRLGGGTANSTTVLTGAQSYATIPAILGYTPLASISSGNVTTALGYTPLRNTTDTWNTDSGGQNRFYFGAAGTTFLDSANGYEFRNGGSNIGRLFANGTFNATGDVVAYSDQRLKDNVYIIDSPLLRLQAINGVTFNWNYNRPDRNYAKDYGVIAQQIQYQFPEMVSIDTDGTLMVAYSKLIPVLIEAVKELDRKIEGLRHGH